eukprot:15182915-Alexandrium_andersonii.AAC.1
MCQPAPLERGPAGNIADLTACGLGCCGACAAHCIQARRQRSLGWQVPPAALGRAPRPGAQTTV